MTINPNLLALQNAINTNTLSAGQQSALSQALSVIIPFFPTPDEISNSIPFDEETLARDWIAALYAVNAGGGSGGAGVTVGTIIATNAANLSATPIVGLPVGQPAVVETFGAEFSLQPAGTLTVDGVTVLASPNAGFVWQRGDSVIIESARAQLDWYIDKVAGNDENSGAVGHPIQHDAEVYRRWGNTWEPVLKGVVGFTIHYLTASPDDTDPAWYAPILEEGATFLQEAAAVPPSSFTGTLLAVTTKSHAANRALESTFTTTTGAIAVDMVLINTTRGNSRATVVRSLGAGLWLLSQPLAPYTGGFPTFTEVDTWANGDAIVGVVPIAMDIARLGGHHATLDGAGDPAHLVQLLTIVDVNNFGGGLRVDGSLVVLENVPVTTRFITVDPESTFLAENATADGGITSTSPGFVQWGGGSIGAPGGASVLASNTFGANLFLDTILQGTLAAEGALGTAFIDTGAELQATGTCSTGGVVYGPGTLNVKGNLTSSNTGTSSLPIAVLQLNGTPSGYSFATGGGDVVVVHGAVPLSGAALDAAASAIGFGGFAQGGGAFISLNGAQP